MVSSIDRESEITEMMSRPRVDFSVQPPDMIERLRLSPPSEMTKDEAVNRIDESTDPMKYCSYPSECPTNIKYFGTKSRMISTSRLIEKSKRSSFKKDKKESIGPWSKAKRRIRRVWDHRESGFGLQTGIQVGFGVSVLAFTVNLVLLVVGAIKHPGYKGGIGILHRGTFDEISRLSTAYHILINILSTGLLTSSSYCMQLLCAPRREDIDAIHARGGYLDVGILSFRNLRFISLRQLIKVFILVFTSAHSVSCTIFLNSSVSEIVLTW